MKNKIHAFDTAEITNSEVDTAEVTNSEVDTANETNSEVDTKIVFFMKKCALLGNVILYYTIYYLNKIHI